MSPYQSTRKSGENTQELQSGPFTKSQSHEKVHPQACNSNAMHAIQ